MSSLRIVTTRGPAHVRVAPLPIIKSAHYRLVGALLDEGAADPIIGNADRIDLNDRAEHLKTVLEAVTAYAAAIVTDTCCSATCLIHDRTDALCNAAADVIAALTNAADHMRGEDAQ